MYQASLAKSKAVFPTRNFRALPLSLKIQWLAGYLEGEAHFRGEDTPKIIIETIDKDIAERVSQLIGGKIHTQNPRQSNWSATYIAYIVSIFSYQALAVMTQIHPLMGKRRTEKIALIRSTFS